MLKKFKTTLLGAIAGAALLSGGCFGDSLDLEPKMKSDLTVEELTARMSRATDPKGVYARAKTYRMKQNVISVDSGKKDISSVEIFYKAPNTFKQVSSRNGNPFVVILYKDGRAWYHFPEENKTKSVPQDSMDMKLITNFMNMLRPGNDYKSIFSKVDIDMTYDELDDKDYYRLICRSADENIAPYIFYIDRKTYMIDKIETLMYSEGHPKLYVSRTENYEWQHNVKKPKRTLVTVAGKTDIADTVAFNINVKIPDSEFELPVPLSHRGLTFSTPDTRIDADEAVSDIKKEMSDLNPKNIFRKDPPAENKNNDKKIEQKNDQPKEKKD